MSGLHWLTITLASFITVIQVFNFVDPNFQIKLQLYSFLHNQNQYVISTYYKLQFIDITIKN